MTWLKQHRNELFLLFLFLGIVAACYISLVSHADNYEVTLQWNMFDGSTTVHGPGWQVSPPWVLTTNLDARPMRVCITTSANAYNCKLVQFIPSLYNHFVNTQGFQYYWWANRFSFNSGYREEYRGFRDIVRGFAFSSIPYDFVEEKR